MTDYKNLCEDLRSVYPLNDYGLQKELEQNSRGFQDMCGAAADAIENLQAENKQPRILKFNMIAVNGEEMTVLEALTSLKQ